ncbi:hypothetical protein [Williamsia serinedens]|uniref:Alpha/beta hydrolase family n=1 Tax=Williamsia serinedens TaxID=391736 RepID=A0ABT1H9U7_9NOCA|nr:hypothetical protein [Williamsia serinedens]MCP2162682.1 Alpha/beta hydrolase family [Williamsia serinedens]
MTARIVRVRGTGEDRAANMLSLIRGVELEYLAEIRPIGVRTFRQSVDAGVAEAVRLDALGPWVGVGYSLGCCVLAEAARYRWLPNLRGLVLVASPYAWGTSMRHGIAGRIGLGDLDIPVREISIDDDPIPNCDVRNGGRQIAVTVTGRAQVPRPEWLDAGAVLQAMWAYGPGGRHTAYGVERPAGDTRTYVEIARDEAYRMAGVNR